MAAAGEPASLKTATAESGKIVNGTIADLQNSDDVHLQTASGYGLTFLDLHNMQLQVSAATGVSEPRLIDLEIESHTDAMVASAIYSLRNRQTGKFEVVGSSTLTKLSDQTSVIRDIPATRF